MMHVSMWFEFLGSLFSCQNHDKWVENVTIRSEIQIEHLFPRVSDKRRCKYLLFVGVKLHI